MIRAPQPQREGTGFIHPADTLAEATQPRVLSHEVTQRKLKTCLTEGMMATVQVEAQFVKKSVSERGKKKDAKL